jgi:hypothetical protein
MRIVVDRSCILETSTHLQETKLKVVVLLSRVERDKTLGEIVNSQLKKIYNNDDDYYYCWAGGIN